MFLELISLLCYNKLWGGVINIHRNKILNWNYKWRCWIQDPPSFKVLHTASSLFKTIHEFIKILLYFIFLNVKTSNVDFWSCTQEHKTIVHNAMCDPELTVGLVYFIIICVIPLFFQTRFWVLSWEERTKIQITKS